MLEIFLIYMLLLLFLFLIGMPIGFALGTTVIAATIHQFGATIPYDMVAQRLLYGVNNFTILAVPFFLFAGNVMNTGGVTKKLFKFADVLIGYVPGGLGHTNILASMFFAGMSGAAVSDAAGLGTIELQAMDDAGYDRDFSIAVTSASSTVGPIIPPSIPFVFYAVQGGVSVGALFLAGIVPGVLMCVAMMALVYFYACRGKCPPPRPRPAIREIFQSFVEAIPPLLTPVIIIGGIYSGKFTPTEAAVIAAIYALFLSTVVYREISWKDLPEIIRKSVKDTVVMAFIVACTYPYAWLVVSSGLPKIFGSSLLSISQNPLVILFIINIFLLVVGCFLDGVCAILIFTPILLPVVTSLGVNPVHFGLVMVLNLMIGLITPPFGLVLFVMSRVANRPLKNVISATVPFLVPLLATLVFITIFPQVVLFLPKALGVAV